MGKLSYEEKLAMKKSVREEKQTAGKKAVKSKHEKSKLTRNGSYSIIITLIIIVICVVSNLIVNKIPAAYTERDITKNDYFTLGDKSKEIVDGVNEDVTVYYLVEDGNENVYIQGIIKQYEGLSKHIKVEKIDPVAYPTFASQYTEDKLNQNSIIVVSGDKNKVIDYYDMFEISYSQSQDYSSSSYSIDAFDGEGRITSAIAYVTSEEVPVVYELAGHGEVKMSDLGIADMIEKENMDLASLSLLQEEKVPDNCATLIINAPTSDISADEASMIKEYIQNGGSIVAVSLYNGNAQPDIKTSMPNLTSLLNEFGIEPVEGLIVESSTSNYYQNQLYLLPTVNSTDIAGDVYNDGRHILAPYSCGIKTLEDKSSDLNITSILTASGDSYAKLNVATDSLSKSEGDIDGPFDIAVGVTNSSNSSKLIYFTSAYMLDPGIDSYTSGANTQLFLNALTLSVGNESSVSIAAKDLEAEPLIVSQLNVSIIKAVTQYIIPLAILIAGGVIWYRRRKN